MPIPRNRIYTVAQAVLTAVQDGLAGEGVAVPDRAYVSAGAPAFDGDVCSLLAVWVESADRTTQGDDVDPFLEDAANWLIRTPRYVVTLARCAATLTDIGAAPSVAVEQAVAEDVYGDATSIVNAVVAAYNAGLLPTSCHGLAYAGWQVNGPSGGMVASEVRFDIPITALET